MDSILEQMYYGQKFVCEKIPYTAKEQERLKDRLKRDENFAALLAPEQQEAFLQYTNDMGDLYAEDTKHFYVEGVKIGIMIGIEAAGALGGK